MTTTGGVGGTMRSSSSSSTRSTSSTLSSSSSSTPPEAIMASTTSASSLLPLPSQNNKNSSSNSSNSSGCAVSVAVRIRPLTTLEMAAGGSAVLSTSKQQNNNNNRREIRLGDNRRFTYDSVFDENVSQQELYQAVSQPLLDSFMEGYNATIMAYGQTGSGKTFTMGSEAHTELELCDSTGLIPRCMKDLFLQLQNRKEQAASGLQIPQKVAAAGANNSNNNETCSAAVVLDYHIEASFLEVYGEDVHDLLLPSRPSVPIREDAGGGVVCSGLTHKKVATAEEALQVLHEGTLHRTTAATLMNLTSSRSHAVFTVTLTQTSGMPGDDYQLTSKSRFTFVDLAGSERMKKTGAEGERAREGIKINEGLLALGNVINALADEGRLAEGKKVHVPYRQSKLTRLLQDALGGNSRTLFLACVSPSDTNASETLSTLHYANRARNIKNAPVQNVDDTRALELQRLHSLNHVLQVELLKAKFGRPLGQDDDDEDGKLSAIGEANVDFLQREEVKVYLQQLQAVAQKKQQSAPAASTSFTPAMMALMSPRRPPPISSAAHAPTMMVASNTSDTPPQNRSVLESFDPTLLAEVNPDEDMAILDQLLELQQRDQDFDDTQKQDTVKLQEVDGELAKQEAMLLQLRESLRVYHDIKTKYELLVTEVQQLEAEKMQLAKELEAATVDPAQGCSAAIRKKLEMVEKTLERARCETRKQQQLCRKAEQDSHRCQALERKIHELKNGRAVMIKKQKEAATRHREYTETKTREIMTLKRKGRIAEKNVSKLQHEVQLHKKNLEKRQIYIQKMNEKQKQTETHLMKLLAMRQRDLRRRTSMMAVPGGCGRRSIMALQTIPESANGGGGGLAGDFAPTTSQEVQTLSFLLNAAMDQQISAIKLKEQYENRMAEYSEAMRQMVVAVKAMGDVKKNGSSIHGEAEIAELEHTVEELELKVELIGSDLENLRTQLPGDDDENREPGQDDDEEETTVARLIKDKPAPIVRTLLIDVVGKYSESMLENKRVTATLARKETAFNILESEVGSLNTKMEGMVKELLASRGSIDDDADAPAAKIASLEKEKSVLSTELSTAQNEVSSLSTTLKQVRLEADVARSEACEAKEKLALIDVASKRDERTQRCEQVLEQIQSIWKAVGVTSGNRAEVEHAIENCLEDACTRQLDFALQLQKQTEDEIERLQQQLSTMQRTLGIETQTDINMDAKDMSLLERVGQLRQQLDQLRSAFQSALARRETLQNEASAISTVLDMGRDQLAPVLRELLKLEEMETTTTQSHDPPINASTEFLDMCEHEIKALRIKKSEILVLNAERYKDASQMIKDMNILEQDILGLVVQSVKRRQKMLPDWWNMDTADTIVHEMTSDGMIMRATKSFTNHLESIHDSLMSTGKSRSQLSNKLGELVERAQKTLLDTVDGAGVDATEAYASFHEALFRLPSLSKERIHACIAEIQALIAGVESMTQSEIEALTVVWEALSVSMAERGVFWGDIEEAMRKIQSNPAGPFHDVLQSAKMDGEEWVLVAVKDASKNFVILETRLLKLEAINKEVEKLRNRQDAKSQILSLDSEIRILNAQLAEFEDQKCNKDRLLNKKTGSAHLLKEERFRKQMKSRFTSKLEQLASLLTTWHDDDGSVFDANLLSEDVRMLLDNPDNMGSIINERKEFMHLRTIKTKRDGTKRGISSVDSTGSESPSPKKKRTLAVDKTRNGGDRVAEGLDKKAHGPVRATTNRKVGNARTSQTPNTMNGSRIGMGAAVARATSETPNAMQRARPSAKRPNRPTSVAEQPNKRRAISKQEPTQKTTNPEAVAIGAKPEFPEAYMLTNQVSNTQVAKPTNESQYKSVEEESSTEPASEQNNKEKASTKSEFQLNGSELSASMEEQQSRPIPQELEQKTSKPLQTVAEEEEMSDAAEPDPMTTKAEPERKATKSKPESKPEPRRSNRNKPRPPPASIAKPTRGSGSSKASSSQAKQAPSAPKALSPTRSPQPKTRKGAAKKRLTLPPFGHVLEQAGISPLCSSDQEKENKSS